MSVAEKRAIGGVWRPRMRSKRTAGLRQVGDLRRAADRARGREQEVLKHRPQQRRRRDALRLGIENAEQIGRRKALPVRACHKPLGSAALGAMRLSARRAPVLFVDQEQQARLRRDGNLGMIAGGFERLAALHQRGMEFVGALNGRAQHRRAQPVELAAAGVDNQQSLRRKNLRVKIRKRLRKSAPRRVGRNQRVRRVRRPENLCRALHQRP